MGIYGTDYPDLSQFARMSLCTFNMVANVLRAYLSTRSNRADGLE